MFGENLPTESTKSNGSDIIKSGYDPTHVNGTQKLRSDFKNALALNPTSVTDTEIRHYAGMHGKLKGQAEMVRRASEQRLATAEAAHEVYQAVLEHTNKAATQELKWQRTTKKNLQELSPKLLDMQIEQEQHKGFTFYCDSADRLVDF